MDPKSLNDLLSAIGGGGLFALSMTALQLYALSNRRSLKMGGLSRIEEDVNESISARIVELEQRIVELSASLERESSLRQGERTSRISMQRRAREEKISKSMDSGFSYVPIGVVHSPFGKRCGTPRQPILCPAAKGKIYFNKSVVQRDHFQEIKDFSHIWVIWSFHGNTNADSAIIPSKIKPPRCSFKVGCLSTRSPHRPNAIGLSVVQVVGVGDDFIEIACIDMIDGTPVLDVKPYIPYDILRFDEQLPMLQWAQSDESAMVLKCPSWIYEADIPFREVTFSKECEDAIENAIAARRKIKGAKAYAAAGNLQEEKLLISQVLQQDIRGRNSRGQCEEGLSSTYNCVIDDLSVSFSTGETSIDVCDVVCAL